MAGLTDRPHGAYLVATDAFFACLRRCLVQRKCSNLLRARGEQLSGPKILGPRLQLGPVTGVLYIYIYMLIKLLGGILGFFQTRILPENALRFFPPPSFYLLPTTPRRIGPRPTKSQSQSQIPNPTPTPTPVTFTSPRTPMPNTSQARKLLASHLAGGRKLDRYFST